MQDNTIVVHHNVSVQIFCIFFEQDTHITGCTELHQQHQQLQHQHTQQQHAQHANQQSTSPFTLPVSGGGGSRPSQANRPGSFSFAVQGAASRRLAMQTLSIEGKGGMGSGNVRVLENSGLTFDYTLSRLQAKLQKSCEMIVTS